MRKAPGLRRDLEGLEIERSQSESVHLTGLSATKTRAECWVDNTCIFVCVEVIGETIVSLAVEQTCSRFRGKIPRSLAPRLSGSAFRKHITQGSATVAPVNKTAGEHEPLDLQLPNPYAHFV